MLAKTIGAYYGLADQDTRITWLIKRTIYKCYEKNDMEIFNVIVGLFSVAAAVSALASYFQASKAKQQSASALEKLIEIEAHIINLEMRGGNIAVAGEMKVGGNVRTHGGVAEIVGK